MTREQELEKAARAVLMEIPIGKISIAARCALDDLRAALAQPPGLAPEMEEVERLANDFGDTCIDYGMDAATRADVEGARAAFLSAIRALPDRYAEGAEAMRLKAQRYVLAVSRATGDGASLERTAEEIGSLPLPTPNPEDRKP